MRIKKCVDVGNKREASRMNEKYKIGRNVLTVNGGKQTGYPICSRILQINVYLILLRPLDLISAF